MYPQSFWLIICSPFSCAGHYPIEPDALRLRPDVGRGEILSHYSSRCRPPIAGDLCPRPGSSHTPAPAGFMSAPMFASIR